MQIIGLDPSFRWDDSGVAAVIIRSPADALRGVGWRCKTRARQTSSSAGIRDCRAESVLDYVIEIVKYPGKIANK